MYRFGAALSLLALTTVQAQNPIAVVRPIGKPLTDLTAAPAVTEPAWAPRPIVSSLVGHPSVAPVLSAIIPGAGQLSLGQDRFVAYGAVELLLWLKRSKDAHEQARQENAYRVLARQVARVNFSTVLPDGDWDYYESMEKWLDSGVYSLSPTDLVPEVDVTTFNGGRWLLAERNHGVDPDAPVINSASYQAALVEYQARAVHPEYLWSWQNAQLEWDLYRRTINQRNDAAHAVGTDVTLLLANHVLSMVDAFTSYRLRVSTSATHDGLTMSVSVPFPR